MNERQLDLRTKLIDWAVILGAPVLLAVLVGLLVRDIGLGIVDPIILVAYGLAAVVGAAKLWADSVRETAFHELLRRCVELQVDPAKAMVAPLHALDATSAWRDNAAALVTEDEEGELRMVLAARGCDEHDMFIAAVRALREVKDEMIPARDEAGEA